MANPPPRRPLLSGGVPACFDMPEPYLLFCGSLFFPLFYGMMVTKPAARGLYRMEGEVRL